MQTQRQARKVAVTLVKSKQAETTSDINKMTVHLEKILCENPGVDLKVKNSLTDANVRASDFIVFCGFGLNTLSTLFQCLSLVELTEPHMKPPMVILYDEPGVSIYEKINEILMSGMDLRRVDPKVFKNILDTWRYSDIINMVTQEIKKRTDESSEPIGTLEPGTPES